MWPRTAALAALVFACGCSGGRVRREAFPIGLFNVNDPALLKRVREAGFDHVFAVGTPEQIDAVAREARRQGLQVVAAADTSLDAATVKRWPLAAWYLQDEPDVNNVSPEQLEAVARRVRAWDPRPQTFTVGSGSEAGRYGAVADIFMLDWYPVPHLALDSVADQIDTAVRYLPKGKPLWFVVQAFDWRDDNPKNPIGRFPKHEEIRFMSWLAIMHGAKGLFFFRLLRPNQTTLFEFPEFWGAVERVSRELKSFQPVLKGGAPSRLPFSPHPHGVEAKSWTFRGRRYVVVLNRKKTFALKLPDELLQPQWRPFFEPGRDVKDLLKPQHGAWYVKPYQVLVFAGPS